MCVCVCVCVCVFVCVCACVCVCVCVCGCDAVGRAQRLKCTYFISPLSFPPSIQPWDIRQTQLFITVCVCVCMCVCVRVCVCVCRHEGYSRPGAVHVGFNRDVAVQDWLLSLLTCSDTAHPLVHNNTPATILSIYVWCEIHRHAFCQWTIYRLRLFWRTLNKHVVFWYKI